MTLSVPSILLITGIMAAGKSTVAQALAERLPYSVHVRGDVFRRMIVNGRREMEPDAAETATQQLHLRYQLGASTAATYCEAGFTVVYQDIIMGDDLDNAVQWLNRFPLYVVVLCPSTEVVAQREAGRSKTGYGAWTPDDLDHELRANTPRLGLWLDSSLLTVDQTVDAVFMRLDKARIIPA